MASNKPVVTNRRTQEERSALARAKLIESAVALICQNSFANTTTQQIADHAGKTRGAIQHHFHDRSELFASILEEVEHRWVLAFSTAVADSNATVADKIDRLMDSLWEVVSSQAYRATLDICMNSRADEKLQPRIEKSTAKSSALFRQYWFDIFKNDLPVKKIDQLRELVTAIYHGIIVSEVFTAEPGVLPPSAKSTFDFAKSVVHSHIAAAQNNK